MRTPKVVSSGRIDSSMCTVSFGPSTRKLQIIQTAGMIVSTDAIKKVDAMLVRQLQIGEYDG